MHVGVVGAGAIGGYVAAELSSAGAEVTLVRRAGSAVPAERPVAVRSDGTVFKPSDSMVVTSDPSALGAVEACIVATKSRDVAELAASLAGALRPDAAVLTLQNGLRSAEALRARLGDRVAVGIVTYNVFVDEQGRRRQASRGKLLAGRLRGVAGARLRDLQAAFGRAGETLELRDDIERVTAGKLLVNLNNGVCAATGLGIAAALADRDARACFAHCLREGLRWMARAGLHPARVTVLPPALLPLVLGLPDAVVSRMARALVGVGPEARFSTLQDLDRGRPTEIDELNGAVVALAERAGGAAPVNALITALVHAHERAAIQGKRPDFVSPRELRARIERALGQRTG